MPEGDVVWSTARRLHTALAGRPLTHSDFRVPRLATTDLRGRRVHEALARGKHLLIRVEGELTVHTHLRMDGSWRFRRPTAPPPRDHRIRLALANAEWLALGYSLGVVELLRTGEEDRAVGHLGPDLLGPDWDLDEAVRRLRERPERAIGEALLDQRCLAGIGNLYKCEVLFLRGVWPWTPVGDVPDLEGLTTLAQRLLDTNRGHWSQSVTGSLRRGETSYVHGRRGAPCRRCGRPIRKVDQGERLTYWCPSCQPEPN
ncbi:Fpg/Nei family DNA glycosylase [Actinomadura sp. HBU206391]|uniref:Fpg/Nei family DNA glycosylase n=1 Tax=Actinomadura sp. HBU206391 TaxID=2731692 RepID=UPI001650A635|nr:Fpg/Nei family DNA glycosylase [Actinomadura sp. HBU206391]MBC6461923.1 Fpg/Nei family DNA glycosylase [Actinomadura sp. HBU206391]